MLCSGGEVYISVILKAQGRKSQKNDIRIFVFNSGRLS